MTPPTPEQQIHFLQQLQRILTDGTFVATYKYALLHALADLAVLKGDDSGAELPLKTQEIAEQVIELYWRQVAPFPAANSGELVTLRQNTGRQAAIVTRLERIQQEYGGSLVRVRGAVEVWNRLLGDVDQVIRKMPLWKLQTVGEERLSFLYENLDRGGKIVLRPGVAYCLRAFYSLIVDLVRGAWLRYLRAYNTSVLGETSELGGFLFGTERGSLATYQPILHELQDGYCFYCGRGIHQAGDVDHFIPWARYPVDLGHNFVLAHGSCNRSKSDHLAAEEHLERWLNRNRSLGATLNEQFDMLGVAYDLEASNRIAFWAYVQTARIGGQVWERGRHLRPLSPEWMRRLFSGNTSP